MWERNAFGASRRAGLRTGLALGLAISAMLASAACGSSDEDRCRGYFQAICERDAECNPDYFAIFEDNDIDTCVERSALLCPVLLALPSSNFRGDAIDRCSDALAGATCAKFNGQFPVECHGAARGNLEPADGCVDGTQCKSGVCIEPANATTYFPCGTCAALRAEGDKCGKSAGVCDTGLLCLGGQCVAAKVLGEPCDNAGDCAIGLACKNGSCQAPLGPEEFCSNNFECNQADYLYCDGSLQVCTVGETAYWNGQCLFADAAGNANVIPCRAGFYCHVNPTITAAKCEPQFADGTTCAGEITDPCLPPATCIAGTCTLPTADVCTTTP